ncbi:ATP-binding protein [Candidatus Oscillochloris fontis]|uniref:ATP-binding protein n=1 Tax=Candidatus Oscillochloris fontis TaxID=2496868 RepID=UPI00101BB828|nr:ATP-binding protein [Candidatus Oscillochloris fontis]
MHERGPINPDALRGIDSQPVIGTSRAMLDMRRVEAHIRHATENGRLNGPTTPVEYLRYNHCLVDLEGEEVATLAGLMCFGYNPQDLFRQAVIDIGHWRGADPLSFEVVHLEKNIGGTLFEQLTRVENYLWTNIHHGMRLNNRSFQRSEVHEYPRAVLRELCVNMIAHRDYTNFRAAARVHLFRNRIEWISPGGLPPGVTVNNLLHEQVARNPVMLNILFEAGFVEAIGQGLNTVVYLLEREGMARPVFTDTGASFIVTIYGRPLDIFYGGKIYLNLNERQHKILSLLRARPGLSPRDIALEFPGRSRRSVQRDLSGLVDAQLITAIGEGRALRYDLINQTPDEFEG